MTFTIKKLNLILLLNVVFSSVSINSVLAQPVDPVYIGPTTGGDSKCHYYLVRDKYGKVWECRTCPWGGPYCFKEE
jgi:hypothetical protein